MKFLLFNLVVAGALVYLFTADRADVHMAADKVYEAADEIKAVARNAVGKGRKLLRGDDAAPAPLPVAPKPLPKTEQKPVPKVSPAPPPVKRLAHAAPAPHMELSCRMATRSQPKVSPSFVNACAI